MNTDEAIQTLAKALLHGPHQFSAEEREQIAKDLEELTQFKSTRTVGKGS